MYKLFRPLIFKASSDPESMHKVVMGLLRMAGATPLSRAERMIFDFQNDRLAQTVFGLRFANPVGLAGGFDKRAEALTGLANLGFGFMEAGTVTRYGQPGNPRPRIFRLEKDKALINRMGFNNHGADAMAAHLAAADFHRVPIGISLGKTKATELSRAAEDYLYSLSKLYDYGDYFAGNISSPNTPGLRQLQDKSFLAEILAALNHYRNSQKARKPILVKIAPDLLFGAVDEVLEVIKQQNLDGVIATNTTTSRAGLSRDPNVAGGLSGKPLRQISTDIIRHIHKQSPTLSVIGVGGIFSADDAYEKIKAGASLVQIYTGLIYEGPGLVKKINQGLVKLLVRDGFKNIGEAVGKGN